MKTAREKTEDSREEFRYSLFCDGVTEVEKWLAECEAFSFL